ncbi:DNA-deoxyinosine glycosylase [Duganella sp. FT3S]|uniref:DNA-deoxyinosine glycosylase n=1 Tax=Rugamonas fusca TaxID=2758568 RepID=A0A7W2EIE1_9BURK|nr:DNA-deoxyinosine glycosylase [Rugamonas fusca]MBA5606478.1 DNA-deoxyinosine glycosylase [Rugamonas fusca]
MSTPSLRPAQAPSAARKRCFDPVVDRHTRVLVLGSLPGEQSLALQQYYGNRQNKFWGLMSQVLDIDLVALEYAARLQALLAHGVGLWDVVAEAERTGSLDSGIRDHASNDLLALVASLPQLGLIAFNGGTAARLGRKQLASDAARWRLLDLPSSSPAYTLPFEQKMARWAALREALA